MTTAGEAFDSEFRLRLADAGQLALTLGQALPESVPGDRFPDATVYRLLAAAQPLYHGAIFTLSDPDTSLAALVLMRSLIETWAHLFFIADNGNMTGSDWRALQLERGWVSELVGIAKAALASGLSDSLTKAESRRRDVNEVWARHRCSGKARSYDDVSHTLKEIEETYPEINWLNVAWRTAASMAHGGGWDWVITDQGDGVSALTVPGPAHRASRLNHLVVLFGNIGNATLFLLGVDLGNPKARAFNDAVQALLDDRFLLTAIDGAFD